MLELLNQGKLIAIWPFCLPDSEAIKNKHGEQRVLTFLDHRPLQQ